MGDDKEPSQLINERRRKRHSMYKEWKSAPDVTAVFRWRGRCRRSYSLFGLTKYFRPVSRFL
jgi:hypothetical protein